MTDQTIPADKVRPILDEWERIKEYTDWEAMDDLVQAVRNLLPAPTLADMTPDEQAACQWMQADVDGHGTRYGIADPHDRDGETVLIAPSGKIVWIAPYYVTPRPDLPRLEWPDTGQGADQ